MFQNCFKILEFYESFYHVQMGYNVNDVLIKVIT